MFTLLKGKEHTKQYLKDQTYRMNYKAWQETKQIEWELSFKDSQTGHLTNETNTFYIISPSLYKEGHIQLTTFIQNIPNSHKTYSTIKELIQDQYLHFSLNHYKLA